jgi:hypothetical protein
MLRPVRIIVVQVMVAVSANLNPVLRVLPVQVQALGMVVVETAAAKAVQVRVVPVAGVVTVK